MDTTTARGYRKIVDMVLTVAGATGIAALFLPFASGISPLDVVVDPWGLGKNWRFAVPAFLPVLIFGASWRWIVNGVFSRAERTIIYTLSAASVCVTLSLIVELLWGGPLNARVLVVTVVSLTALVVGLLVVIKDLRIREPRGFNPVMAIQVAYVGHALMCLLLFVGYWEVGASFVLTTIVAYSAQIVRVMRRPGLSMQEITGTN